MTSAPATIRCASLLSLSLAASRVRSVTGGQNTGVDYKRLIEQFGTQELTEELLARMERLSGRPLHRFLRRGLFFSHRSLGELLDAVEKGEPFYLYTGTASPPLSSARSLRS
jgi:hypothetical protein